MPSSSWELILVHPLRRREGEPVRVEGQWLLLECILSPRRWPSGKARMRSTISVAMYEYSIYKIYTYEFDNFTEYTNPHRLTEHEWQCNQKQRRHVGHEQPPVQSKSAKHSSTSAPRWWLPDRYNIRCSHRLLRILLFGGLGLCWCFFSGYHVLQYRFRVPLWNWVLECDSALCFSFNPTHRNE